MKAEPLDLLAQAVERVRPPVDGPEQIDNAARPSVVVGSEGRA